MNIHSALTPLCWTRQRSDVLLAVLLTVCFDPVLNRLTFMLILTWLPQFQSTSVYICLSLQAAEWDEPTNLFCQRQWQWQGQWCRWQQDRDQSGHAFVSHGMHWYHVCTLKLTQSYYSISPEILKNEKHRKRVADTYWSDSVKVIVCKNKTETEQEWKQWKGESIHYESERSLVVWVLREHFLAC